MTTTPVLAAACCLLVAAAPAQDQDTGPAKTNPAKTPPAPAAGEDARDVLKEAIEKMKATGHIFIHPAPAIPIHGTLPWPPTPLLDDVAFQGAFQKLWAAQQELAMADTPAKARKALDKIEKASMEIRRALWKAGTERRRLHPRPLPIVTGVRIELLSREPQAILPGFIR